MKRIFLVICLLITFCMPVFSAQKDDDKEETAGSMADYLGGKDSIFDDPFAGQKMYSDEEFQKALEFKKSHMKKKKEKKFKGEGRSADDSKTQIDETAEKTIILMLSCNLVNGDGTFIPMGHYKIVGEQNDNGAYLNFYQAHRLIAKVPAIVTKYDFDQDIINFAKILPYSDDKIKLIFGSIDFNAWTLLRVVN